MSVGASFTSVTLTVISCMSEPSCPSCTVISTTRLVLLPLSVTSSKSGAAFKVNKPVDSSIAKDEESLPPVMLNSNSWVGMSVSMAVTVVTKVVFSATWISVVEFPPFDVMIGSELVTDCDSASQRNV